MFSIREEQKYEKSGFTDIAISSEAIYLFGV